MKKLSLSFLAPTSLFVFAALTACSHTAKVAQNGNAGGTPAWRDPAAANADDLERLERETVKYVDMFAYRQQVIRTQGFKAIETANAKLVELLEQTAPSQKSIDADAREGASWRASITMQEANDLYRWLESHPVAASSRILKYDPQIRIGFCFGRATAVHLEALHKPYRLYPKSIRKIWVIGPMLGGWGHHVATLVHIDDGANKGFYAVDPVTYGVVPAKEWMATVTSEYKLNEPLMFFVTDPSRFGPFPGKYTQIDLFGPQRGNVSADAYAGYFNDMMKKFHVDSSKNLDAAKKSLAAEMAVVPAVTAAMPDLNGANSGVVAE